MTDQGFDAGPDFSGVSEQAAEARAALKRTAEEGRTAARLLSEEFELAGDSIVQSLEGAARSGEFSFRAMAETIAQSLAQLALDRYVLEPFPDLFGRAASGLGDLVTGVIGQRAEGGPVLAGEAYLVGERGPEVFTPGQAGAISPMGAAPMNITIIAQGQAEDSVRRSERQIAAAVARAVQQGGRSL